MNDRIEQAIEAHLLEQLQLQLSEEQMAALELKVLLIRKLSS